MSFLEPSENKNEKEKAFKLLSRILSLLNEALANEGRINGNKSILKVKKFVSIFSQRQDGFLSGFVLLSNSQHLYFELDNSQIQYTDALSFIEKSLSELLLNNGYSLRKVCSYSITESAVIGKVLVYQHNNDSESEFDFRITTTKIEVF